MRSNKTNIDVKHVKRFKYSINAIQPQSNEKDSSKCTVPEKNSNKKRAFIPKTFVVVKTPQN